MLLIFVLKIMNNSESAVDRFLIYGDCNQHSYEAARVYTKRYPEKYHSNHIIFLSLVGSLRIHEFFSNRNFTR